MARLFKTMGMLPVGYYDLTVAGLPVHATAFRPVTGPALLANPFRVFTSLLRLDLLEPATRKLAEETLARRDIFSPTTRYFLDLYDRQGGLRADEAKDFIESSLETFRFRLTSKVGVKEYELLQQASPLAADVVSFAGPHINHLTPCTLDIDAVQDGMIARGIPPKSIIEGPPHRACGLLLRQTSFMALTERVLFVDEATHSTPCSQGQHRARFGEVEQRGAALTPKGRELFEACFARARATPVEGGSPKQPGSPTHVAEGEKTNAVNDAHQKHLRRFFGPDAFPDDWESLRRQGLVYVKYSLAPDATRLPAPSSSATVDDLVASGHAFYQAITYEDFLPASAAGIFSSNLGGDAVVVEGKPDQAAFEAALGGKVQDSHELYSQEEQASIARVRKELGLLK